MYIPFAFVGQLPTASLDCSPIKGGNAFQYYYNNVLYIQHQLNSETFEINRNLNNADVLVVGAGGTPSGRAGAGGGGVIYSSSVTLLAGSYTAVQGVSTTDTAKSSSLSGPLGFSMKVAGGQNNNTGTGSSGGGGNDLQYGGSGIPGQGYNGGNGRFTSPFGTSGGGGGAGAPGQDAPAGVGGNGGIGVSVPIFLRFGENGYFGGGGGGGTNSTATAGNGGLGGGGRGGQLNVGGANGGSGTGGGGGGKNPNGFGGTGGSGTILISYSSSLDCFGFNDYTWWTSCCDGTTKYLMAIASGSSVAVSSSVIYNECAGVCVRYSSSVSQYALPSGSACYTFNQNADWYGVGDNQCSRCISQHTCP